VAQHNLLILDSNNISLTLTSVKIQQFLLRHKKGWKDTTTDKTPILHAVPPRYGNVETKPVCSGLLHMHSFSWRSCLLD